MDHERQLAPSPFPGDEGLADPATRRQTLKGAAAAALGLLGLGAAGAGAQDTTCRSRGQTCGASAPEGSGRCCGNLRCCQAESGTFFCRDILTDENNCGGCAPAGGCQTDPCPNVCGGEEVCLHGACFSRCEGSPRAGTCPSGNTFRCEQDNCACVRRGDRQICESQVEGCAELEACQTNADCPVGRLCVNEGCCRNKPFVCVRPCNPPF